MNNAITTLEQAELVLRKNHLVHNERVEGKQLLDVCGYSYTEKNVGQMIERQINKHNLHENRDFYFSSINAGKGRPRKIWKFTVNAANHVLLSAITPEGKQARQEAIDMKQEPLNLIRPQTLNITVLSKIESIVGHVQSLQQEVSEIEVCHLPWAKQAITCFYRTGL